jgi:hypothetical protein
MSPYELLNRDSIGAEAQLLGGKSILPNPDPSQLQLQLASHSAVQEPQTQLPSANILRHCVHHP